MDVPMRRRFPVFTPRSIALPGSRARLRRPAAARASLGAVALLLVLAASAVSGLAGASEIVGRPFEPLSGPRGATMFAAVSPEASGVRTENRYADPAMWGKLYHEFEIGPIGTGVAIADYDGDGRPDIFVVSKTESCRLFRNLGGWRFEDVTVRAGVGDTGAAAAIWKQGATFADVNNDGRPDLYLCRFGAPNLLYLNQGDGTFREGARAAGLDVSDASLMATFCDYDRDGWLDVYVQTNLLNNSTSPAGQPDTLFRNDGDGTFTDVTAAAGLHADTRTQGNSAMWWDYDNDGWPDLYVANDFAVPDFLYRNRGDGTFTDVIDSVVPHTTYSSMSSDIGDVDGDGLIDLAVTDMAATTHEKDQRGMADTRSRTRDPADGATAVPNYLRNTLFLNTGTGRCAEAAFLAGIAATDWTWSTRFEDFDNDGRLDLHVTNGMHREVHNLDILLRMMTAESAADRVKFVRGTPVFQERNLAYRNAGELRFEEVGAAWGLDQLGVSFGAAFGDLDGDGDLDIVYTNYEAGATVLRNDSDTGQRLVVELRGTISNRFGAGAHVTVETDSGRQVRQLVLARGYMSSSEPMLHFGLGAATTVRRLTVRWPSGHEQVFSDLAAGQRYMITEPAGPAPAAARTPQHPAPGQFTEVGAAAGLALDSYDEPVDEIAQQRLLPVRHNRRGPGLAVGDIDGRPGDDVVLAGTARDLPRVLVQTAPAKFSAAAPSPFVRDPVVTDGPVLLVDADGDGRQDLLQTKGGSSMPDGSAEYQPRLYLGDGHGVFQPAPAGALPALPISVGAAAAADFDRDGRLDLFLGGRVAPVRYPLAPQSALLANRGPRAGAFADVTDALAPALRRVGMVTAALWCDVDLDDWPDLVLATEWGAVRCFRNDRGQRFEDWSGRLGFEAAGTGWWTSLAAADFNGDGRQDFAAGNVGLNTQYHASPGEPAVLLLGDFRGNGTPLLVEAHHENGRLLPWRTRRHLGAAVPSILKRFPTNNAYAAATLEEILGADKVQAAERWIATELQSGIFLSQPDGTYRFTPGPRLAQIAPWQGTVAADFDGDGHADIAVVHNSYAPNPVTGRFDGGLGQVLRGDGRGGFAPLPWSASGLVVPGDAKALAVLDLDDDGWPDLLASRNGSTTLAFRNGGVPGRRMLRVSLEGPAGNPAGVGARVTVTLADGSRRVYEIAAGSGLASQSAASVFVGYEDGRPPRAVEVRWPGGATTQHEVASGAARLSLQAPAR
jgi:hypothetical protein